jgi:hypothetical protein
MAKKSLLINTALYTALACAAVTFAQAPVVNIDPHHHPNLAEAQKHIVEAYQKIDVAQHDNNERLGNHAQRAKELLTQADAELRAAANVANAEHH